jgi:hypothetical protein
MISPLIIIPGVIFSVVSGFLTWLSWRDSRTSFQLIAKLETRIDGLERRLSSMSTENGSEEKMLKS